MSPSVETTTTTTTKKQKLNNGAPITTMSAPNPTPLPAPSSVPPPAPTNGVQPQWAQIPIDPALQNTHASPVQYPQYAWPPQPTGTPVPAATPAPTNASTPQPIRAKPSTPAPASTASPKPATTTTPATPTTATQYAPPYYAAAPPGYRYPYPPQYQGQPQYAYPYVQAPGGQYYAVAAPPPQQQAAPQAQGQVQPQAQQARVGVVLPTVGAPGVAIGVAGAQAQQAQQQPTSTLNDALAGIVDLRAEEDALARSHQDVGNTYYHREGDRSKRVGPALEQSKIWMSERLKAILSAQGLTNLPEEALNYAMLAWKARLQMLWDKALTAAEHRATTQYSRAPSFWNPPAEGSMTAPSSVPPTPMWSTLVKRDVAKQLSAIERAEKEEETRVRRERRTLAAQAEAEDAVEDDMDVDGRKAKKMRALGPGVTARTMPEDVKKKMSDNTANRAAGLGTGKYAWMTAGAGAGAAPAPPKPKPVVPTPSPAPVAPTIAVATGGPPAPAAAPVGGATPKAGGWGRAYAAVTKSAAAAGTETAKEDGITVTLRDALFVASRERGFGAGRGSALATAGRWE